MVYVREDFEILNIAHLLTTHLQQSLQNHPMLHNGTYNSPN